MTTPSSANIAADGKGNDDDANSSGNRLLTTASRSSGHHGRRPRSNRQSNHNRAATPGAAATTTATGNTTSNSMTDEEWREEQTMRKILEERARCFRPNEQAQGDDEAPPPSPPLPPLLGGPPAMPTTQPEVVPPPTQLQRVTTETEPIKDAKAAVTTVIPGSSMACCVTPVIKAEMEVLEHGEKNSNPDVIMPSAQPGAFAVRPPQPQEVEVNNNSNRGSWDEEVDVDALIVMRMEDATTRTTQDDSSDPTTLIVDEEAPALDAVLVTEDDLEKDKSLRSQPPSSPSQASANVTVGSPLSSSASLDKYIDSLPVFDGKIDEGDPQETNKYYLSTKVLALLTFLLLLVAILLALGLSGAFDRDNNIGAFDRDNSIPPLSNQLASPTMERIQRTGTLRCAHNDYSLGITNTLDVELCHAVAAALGAEVELVDGTLQTLFQELNEDRVDMGKSANTMELELLQATPEEAESKQRGFRFSSPVIYGGFRVAGDPFYVKCAENGFKHLDECKDIKLCVIADSGHEFIASEHLPQRSVVPLTALGTNLTDGVLGRDCNIIGLEGYCLVEAFIREHLRMNGYELGTRQFSKGVYSIVTREDDPVFADFVESVLQALLAAEYHNITQDESDKLPQTNLFGPDYRNMFRQAIARVGNFGDLHARAYPLFTPRNGMNRINQGDTGLLYAPPFGEIEASRDEIPLSPVMKTVLDRGMLRCGIQTDRPGFATLASSDWKTYKGMDVDYCRAVAASLLDGDADAVEFVVVPSQSDGFVMLANGDIDVLPGATWTLENDILEPTTKQGFTFSQPYFYGYSDEQDNLSLATRQDDHDWSTFVDWTVSATIYAEEIGANQTASHQMPEVYVYGEDRKRMFRDCILAVGSYAEIYDRNIASYIPRGGRNVLNTMTSAEHYLVPGIL